MSSFADGGAGRVFRAFHGPTWLIAIAIYGGWLALTLLHASVPLPLLIFSGGFLIAWQGSLQHETIHGHPAGPRWVRRALGAPPLSLWLPYDVYRETHRRHHATANLTDPLHDPESPFLHAEQWRELGPLRRALARCQRTVLGRLLVGPLVLIAGSLYGEARAIAAGGPGRRKSWALHMLMVACVLAWIVGVAQMPIWKYLLAFVYPGAALTLLRSLAEHRPDPLPERRTAVVEAGLFFRLLFLNNNLHVMHHRAPHIPWFDLPAHWERERAAFERAAPHLVHRGYGEIVRRHAVRPISKVELS